jgi:hypothetical protein
VQLPLDEIVPFDERLDVATTAGAEMTLLADTVAEDTVVPTVTAVADKELEQVTAPSSADVPVTVKFFAASPAPSMTVLSLIVTVFPL